MDVFCVDNMCSAGNGEDEDEFKNWEEAYGCEKSTSIIGDFFVLKSSMINMTLVFLRLKCPMALTTLI